MSTTVEVAFAPQVSLTTLLSDEDFEVFGIDTEAISDPHTGHSTVDNPTLYNSTFNFYTEDEYLDLTISLRFNEERASHD